MSLFRPSSRSSSPPSPGFWVAAALGVFGVVGLAGCAPDGVGGVGDAAGVGGVSDAAGVEDGADGTGSAIAAYDPDDDDDEPRVGSGARTGAAPGEVGQVRFGLAVKGSDPAAIEQLADSAGARPGVVRVFTRWDTPFPTADHQALLDAGYPVHLSVRPRTDGGLVIPWGELALADDESMVIDQLRDWLLTAAAYDGQIHFTLNHEPETRDSADNGTAAEYVAAWRRMAELRDEVTDAETVPLVFVVGRGAYADGSVDDWYPGDDVVDVVGADAYNWFDCQGTDRPWIEPEPLLEPALAFADAHGKPLALPEIASTEDGADPDRKAEWIRALGAYLTDDAVADRIAFVAWFSVHDRSWPDCAWEYDSSAPSQAAFEELIGGNGPANGQTD